VTQDIGELSDNLVMFEDIPSFEILVAFSDGLGYGLMLPIEKPMHGFFCNIRFGALRCFREFG